LLRLLTAAYGTKQTYRGAVLLVRFRGKADNQTGFDVALGQSDIIPAASY